MVRYITRIGVQSAAKSAQSLWNVCGMSGGWQKVGRKRESTGRIASLHTTRTLLGASLVSYVANGKKVNGQQNWRQ